MLNDEKEFSTKNKGVELDCELLLLPALFWNIFLPVGWMNLEAEKERECRKQ